MYKIFSIHMAHNSIFKKVVDIFDNDIL